MMTSLSTMATTRSSSTICACRPVLISRPAHRPISFACSLKCIGFSLSVTGDAVFQERFHATTGDIAEAFEDKLQEDATVRLVVEPGIQTGFIVIDPVAVDHPQFPAAAVVLEAAEGLDGAVATIITLPAADQAPLVGNRPHEGNVMLVGLVVVGDVIGITRFAEVGVGGPDTLVAVETHGLVAIAVADVEDLARVILRLIVPHGAAAAGLALVGVPVDRRREAPVLIVTVLVDQRHRRLGRLGFAALAVIDAAQLHFAVPEVVRLTDAEGLPLDAPGVYPAVGQTQRDLVGITDAIPAREAVVAPQGGVAECRLATVEDRNVALIFLRHVQVEQAWFQRLVVALAEHLGRTVEVQSAVDTEDRHAAILAAVKAFVEDTVPLPETAPADAVQRQVVARIGVLGGRLDEAPVPIERQADARLQMQAVALGASQASQAVVVPAVFLQPGITVLVRIEAAQQAALEADELGVIAQTQAARLIKQGAAQQQLRQPLVGGDLGYRGPFVGMHVEGGEVVVATPCKAAALVEEVAGIDAQEGFQVLEVVVIADVGVIDTATQARSEVTGVLPAVHPALVLVSGLQLPFILAVIQHRGADLAGAGRCQVAELALQLQAPVGHQRRVQGGVVVGRQVEIVGLGILAAGVAAVGEARYQQAALAAVVNWEVDIRGIEHRHILHPQGDVPGLAPAFLPVQLDIIAVQAPGVTARLARSVGAVGHDDNRIITAAQAFRCAAGIRLVHHIAHLIDAGLAGVDMHLPVFTQNQYALVAQTDVAFQADKIVGTVKAGLVGLCLQSALAQHHVTLEGTCLLVLLEAAGVGTGVDRQLIEGGVVVAADAIRLDIVAAAIGRNRRLLRRCQLVAGNPVQFAEVHRPGLSGGRGLAGLFSRGRLPGRLAGAYHRCLGAGWQLTGGFQRVAGPAAAVTAWAALDLAGSQTGYRLGQQQSAGQQQGECGAKRRSLVGHYNCPGFQSVVQVAMTR